METSPDTRQDSLRLSTVMAVPVTKAPEGSRLAGGARREVVVVVVGLAVSGLLEADGHDGVRKYSGCYLSK